jgi:nucleotide-binding universal stress UspA family protein
VSPFPTKILLATDGSKEAALAARSATDLADKTESELHVVYVEPWPPIIDPEADERVTEAITEKKMKRAKKFVDAQVQEIEAAGGTVAQAYARKGGAAEEIVALAEEIGAGLIVVGSRGWARLRWALMGSVSESVVRYAHCPVLVVRKENHKSTVDVTDLENRACKLSTRNPPEFGRCILVHRRRVSAH